MARLSGQALWSELAVGALSRWPDRVLAVPKPMSAIAVGHGIRHSAFGLVALGLSRAATIGTFAL